VLVLVLLLLCAPVGLVFLCPEVLVDLLTIIHLLTSFSCQLSLQRPQGAVCGHTLKVKCGKAGWVEGGAGHKGYE
jgi:hypothetical protein